MNGQMMQQPLLISSLLTHAERHHRDQQIVSKRVEGDIHRTTFGELAARSRRVANTLAGLGVSFGQRVATLGATGKMLKNKLREQFKDHKLPTA